MHSRLFDSRSPDAASNSQLSRPSADIPTPGAGGRCAFSSADTDNRYSFMPMRTFFARLVVVRIVIASAVCAHAALGWRAVEFAGGDAVEQGVATASRPVRSVRSYCSSARPVPRRNAARRCLDR
jgi:hypothetical protein